MTMTMDKTQISRRSVLAGLGGMIVLPRARHRRRQLFSAAEANTPADAKAFNAWVRIAPNGTVTILSAGAEMGQGSMTTLPMIVAEEMDADWSKVAIEMAPADASVYGYMMNDNSRMMAIVGSRATMLYYNDLRTAGAQVRKVLLMNAAEKWGVDAAIAAHRAGRRDQSGERPAPELRRDRGVRQNPLAAAGGRRERAQGRRRTGA